MKLSNEQVFEYIFWLILTIIFVTIMVIGFEKTDIALVLIGLVGTGIFGTIAWAKGDSISESIVKKN